MSKTLIIMAKEIMDNLRDRRSMFFALVYGSVLMPVLMFGPMIYGTNQHFSQNYETPITIHVHGEDRAPNLLQHLHARNIDFETAPEDFREQLVQGEIDLVVDIAENYGEKLLAGSPARVTLHYNDEEGDSRQSFWRLRAELQNYSQTLAAQRMLIRGFDNDVLKPLDIIDSDLSEEEAGAGMLANLIIFLLVLSMTMGGFYLAIDSTAGERERLSLEPLLSLAVTRFQVVLGKYLAILVFVFVAFLLPMISVVIAVSFIPEGFFGNVEVPGALTYLKLLALNLPLCLLISGFLMAIAAYSKSVKEAQTQLGFAMLVPMTPFFLVQFMDLSLSGTNSAIPILSQYLLADQILTNASFSLVSILPSAAATVGLGALFFLVAVHLYRDDAILG